MHQQTEFKTYFDHSHTDPRAMVWGVSHSEVYQQPGRTVTREEKSILMTLSAHVFVCTIPAGVSR